MRLGVKSQVVGGRPLGCFVGGAVERDELRMRLMPVNVLLPFLEETWYKLSVNQMFCTKHVSSFETNWLT